MITPSSPLPLKSIAGALLFSVLLGPVGLLYSSFWGGVVMIIAMIVALSSHTYFVATLVWLGCCIWSVGAVEHYNKKLLKAKF